MTGSSADHDAGSIPLDAAADPATADLVEELLAIRDDLLRAEGSAENRLAKIPPHRQGSARNLIHYIALRRHDIRTLQERLVPRGLSSLGRCEGYVRANLDAVLRLLDPKGRIDPPGEAHSSTAAEIPPVQFEQARSLLRGETRRLFGVSPSQPAIMVTMPSEAAAEETLVADLLQAGMSVMRINCAHDDAESWAAMIENLRRAEQGQGRSCRVAMDLAGPKIRTVIKGKKNRKLQLHPDDLLLIARSKEAARAAIESDKHLSSSCPKMGCSLSEVFQSVRVDDRVLFDDGKIAGIVEDRQPDVLVVRITRAKETGTKLRDNKGINFPDSDLSLPALTEKDRKDLEFVAGHADLVNYSFVRHPSDIEILSDELHRLDNPELPVILKVENPQSFANLPRLLLESMQRFSSTGVMIARGDLAVECGWERLVEVQEEILWMCEAAHVPVVWATQVLEGLAKKGLPSRAEITDAGAGSRAECVMLNKGDNIVETVRTLHDILIRMQEHQSKKRPMFRRLGVAGGLIAD